MTTNPDEVQTTAPLQDVLGSQGAAIASLRAENRNLSDKLSQCQADKDFVWSLWKRLQVANPDVTQAISLVLQREKEKTELKDRKVLEILHIKDDQIAQLRKVEKQLSEEVLGLKECVQSLEAEAFVNNDEGEKLKATNKTLTADKDALNVENGMLKSKLVEAEKLLQELKTQNESSLHEHEQLLEENKSISEELIGMKKELNRSDQQNERLLAKIKELKSDITEISKTAQIPADEHMSSNTELLETKKQLDQWKQAATSVEQDLNKLRKKYSDMKKDYQKTIAQTSEQLQVITQLQSLQAETQKMLKNQENAHVIEASNYLAMNKELQARFDAVQDSELNLQKLLSQVHSEKHKTGTQDAYAQTEEPSIESPWVERFSRQTNMKMDGAQVSRSPFGKRRAKSLSPMRSWVTIKNDEVNQSGDEDVVKMYQTDYASNRRSKELRKLLALKEEELTEMRRAHHGRLARLQSLQKAHNTLKEQIKTYENQTGKKKKKVTYRADPKLLQKEDSDAVWNELTYYKQRTGDLQQEKMNLEEELDCLKVQTASDACTIEDLAVCLQQDKKEMQSQVKKMKEIKMELEKERRAGKNGQDVLESLKAELVETQHNLVKAEGKMADFKMRCSEAERECRKYKAECSRLDSEMILKVNQIQALQEELESLQRRQKEMSHSKIIKKHQRSLNRSIEKMSSVFPDLNIDDWEEVSVSRSEDDDGERIQAPVTSTPRRQLGRKRRKSGHVRARSWDSSFRQLSSVQKHLMRMARAYEQKQAGVTIHKELINISTQTEDEPGYSTASVVDVGVGNLDVRSEMGSNSLETDSSDLSPTLSASSEQTIPPVEASLSALRKTKSSPNLRSQINVRNLQKRIVSLQQQVTLLKSSKVSLQRISDDQVKSLEKLNSDLVQTSHQLSMSRQTVQRLTRQLDDCKVEQNLLKKELQELKDKESADKKSAIVHKHMEERLKSQAEEIVRQGATIKSLKEEAASQTISVKALQEKINRLEKDNSQKRSLIEDLRGKARAAEEQTRTNKNELELLEQKLKQCNADSCKRRTEVDSLKKQLAAVRGEKVHYEERWTDVKSQLQKQKSLLETTRNKQIEAEKSLLDLEHEASQQLQGLTEQSEKALRLARVEMQRLKAKIDQLQHFIMDLTRETQRYIRSITEKPPQEPESDGISARELSLAASLLNLSADDWQGFMEEPKKGTSEEEDEAKLSELNVHLNAQNLDTQHLLDFFHVNVLTSSSPKQR